MGKEKLSVGLLYLGLHNYLLKNSDSHRTMTRKEFFERLGRHYLLPKQLRPLILKEMEEFKLIKRIHRDCIEILEQKINLEKNPLELYNVFKTKLTLF